MTLISFKFDNQSATQVAKIQLKAYPKCYQERPQDLMQVYQRQDCFGFGIQESDHLLGYCVGFPMDPMDRIPVIHQPLAGGARPTRPRHECPVFLYDCVVDPDVQGSGWGSTVVKAFINEASRLGYKRIWACAVGQDAGRFWNRFGFKIVDDQAIHTNHSSGSEGWWAQYEVGKELPDIYKTTGKSR